MKKLLVGVTGSIAAKYTVKLVNAIITRIPDVVLRVIATEHGLYFFDREKIPVLVMNDKYEWPEAGYTKGDPVPHIDLGDWADELLIAPLTADTLSDMAHGKANKFLTSTVLAWPLEKPMILAPAMNTRMWQNPITQENLQKVQKVYRAQIVGPVVGRLACGTVGVGAMADINDIVSAVISA